MDYVRYLAAKRSVDDRAINARVMQSFQAALEEADRTDVLRVLEVGAGIGAMAVRLVAAGALRRFDLVEYTLVDVKRELLVEARALISRELGGGAAAGAAPPAPPAAPAAVLRGTAIAGANAVHHDGTAEAAARAPIAPLDVAPAAPGPPRLRVSFLVADALSFAAGAGAGRYDAVVAAAFLDLFDAECAAGALLSALDRGRGRPAAFYFAVNFDGVTALAPAAAGDAAAERRFHAAMGADDGGARAHTGRRLLDVLGGLGAEVRAAGGSAWVVRPEGGRYAGDEAYFLRCILGFMEGAVVGADAGADGGGGEGEGWGEGWGEWWIATRRAQLRRAALTYVAHNLDMAGRAAGGR